jgi:hypothetical protein
MHEGVKRLRTLAKAAGVIAGLFVLVLTFNSAQPQTLGLPEILGVAAVWGFLAWGVFALIAWLVEGFAKRSTS